jgi:RND superfamily putative drug exporter
MLNFTPGPIMSPVLVLIIAIVYGLSTDYEVFLLSRMVEARAQGASTTESIRIGTAHTGRIITAAALILIVVTGAFGLSDLVMMKYISYGMIAALVIDATLIRMFLVPATMKLLGDDCWWAPAWMKRIQQKIGLGEPILDNELALVDVPQLTPVGAIAGPAQAKIAEPAQAKAATPSRVLPPTTPVGDKREPDPLTEPIPLSEMSVKAPTPKTYAPGETPRRRSTDRPASAPQDLIEAPVPNPTYKAAKAEPAATPPPTARRTSPATPAPAERPIESWLSDLRTPGETPPASRPLPVVRTSAPTNGAGTNGAATNGAATNGAGTNGASTNGAGANGAGANGAATNGAASESTPNGPSSGNAASGRHRPDDGNAVSVSELIARQKRS